jgi:hypothetical protein
VYYVNKATLDTAFPDLLSSADPIDREVLQAKTSMSVRAVLQEARLFSLYNHPSGFFARAEALWVSQDNDGYPADGGMNRQGIPLVSPANGADFWQYNVYAGYRFPRNVGDVTVGFLNLTNQDYMLNPLNEYAELPRSFTVSVQTRLNF